MFLHLTALLLINAVILIFKVSEDDYNAASDTVRLRKYKNPIPSDDYCVDRDNNSTELVVTCDQCKEGKLCIHKCCPFNKKFDISLPDDIYDSEIGSLLDNSSIMTPGLPLAYSPPCVDSDNPMPTIPFTDPSTQETLDWKEGINYIIVGPTEESVIEGDGILFTCPIKDNLWSFEDNVFLDKFGRVNGVLNYETKKEDKRYVPGTYCVFDNNNAVGISICQLEKEINPNACEITRKYTFNTAFIVSIIFIILAILAHVIEKQLNVTVFGKISVVFLFNLLGNFVTIMVERMNGFERETAPCVWVAYLFQYFGLAIFFSINTLAYICLRTVREMADEADNKILVAIGNFLDPKKKYFLLKGIAYIQGFPLIIGLITYALDMEGKQRYEAGERDLNLFPNAGDVFCHMSFQNPNGDINYFVTPEFIYLQSFQLFIFFINFVIFAITVKSYFTFQVTPDNVKKREQQKKDFKIVVQLFFTMLCFWIFEIITSAINTDYGTNESCPVRFVLDTPNAFFGLLAFLMLVCMKPTVVKSLRETITSTFGGPTVVSTRVSTMKGTKSQSISTTNA